MWQVIASIVAAIVGFTSGLGGTSNQTQPVDTYTLRTCYNPEPNVRLTLNWPGNFHSISDNRITLNPNQFKMSFFESGYRARLTPSSDPTKPPTLDTTNNCQQMMLTDAGTNQTLTSRNYIRVRQNVRIASCKVDELGGPFNTGGGSCVDGSLTAAKSIRGTCNFQGGYMDLRKVAEVNQNGEVKEIFWNPFTHNVGCRYDPAKPNCGPGNTANLKDFLYVLTKRDAFDSANPANCKILWDAGSTNKDACSHYFDVYMAEDLYNKMDTLAPSDDRYYFLKQVVENCQEQDIFIPLPDTSAVTFPPVFLEKPFVTGDFYLVQENKILPNPADSFEVNNYTFFVLSSPTLNPLTTSLIQYAQPFSEDLTICTTTPNDEDDTTNTCYAPIGNIIFKPETDQSITFKVYSRGNSPQTFYFSDTSGTDNKIYQYTITEATAPKNIGQAPALQLKSLEFSTANEWTWATPLCKPAIYLYPEKEIDLTVKLNVAGQLTKNEPLYDAKEGWKVKAYPDGTIEHITKNIEQKTYPYLYYEADITGIEIPKEGWVVEKSRPKTDQPLAENINPSVDGQISKIMKEIGFNEKEISDFLAYWLPRLSEKPYYFLTLLPEDIINEKETLSFSTKPDTLIRVRFVFEGLDYPLSLTPLTNIPKYQRKGFTVTDWGGTLIGKSCSEVTVN